MIKRNQLFLRMDFERRERIRTHDHSCSSPASRQRFRVQDVLKLKNELEKGKGRKKEINFKFPFSGKKTSRNSCETKNRQAGAMAESRAGSNAPRPFL